ncbi:hypothetical protein SynA1560_01305 [Synechococcus sp. A15-60]|nr:hypothetical protein SynA1560_01305 [Synechococcus sp. A15-60]
MRNDSCVVRRPWLKGLDCGKSLTPVQTLQSWQPDQEGHEKA